MISEDFSLEAFQTQIITILSDYFASHPEDLHNEALRKRIIEAITQSLEGQHLWQKDGLDQSISQAYYFESLGRAVESDDEAYHLLFRDASINQDGAIGIVCQVKQENQQTENESLNYDAVLYSDEENGPRHTTTIGAMLSIKQKDRKQTNQSPEGNMMNMGDEKANKRVRPIQMGRKKLRGIDRISETHFEDDDSDYESLTFELNQSQFSVKPKKNQSRNLSKKRQSSNRKRPQSRKPSFPQMEKILINWIKINCQRSIVVSQFEIRKEAMRILQKLDKSKHPYFRASKGWLEKFFKRNKEVYQLLSRERHRSHISIDMAFGLL